MASTIKSVGNAYPWDEWTDGKARRAKKGRDFSCSAEGFASTLYTHASRKSMGVRVSVPDPKTVEFQFLRRKRGQ
jgi:hypothetical protein